MKENQGLLASIILDLLHSQNGHIHDGNSKRGTAGTHQNRSRQLRHRARMVSGQGKVEIIDCLFHLNINGYLSEGSVCVLTMCMHEHGCVFIPKVTKQLHEGGMVDHSYLPLI